MAYITRQGIGTLISVEKRNPDIPEEEYQWRREYIDKNGTFFLLTDEDNPNLNMAYVHCGFHYYRTGVGPVTIEPISCGLEKITLTTPNSIWVFHLLPGIITGELL